MTIEPSQVSLGHNVYVAPTAYVGGNVTLGDECTVMHHVTIRGDVATIRIGRRVNIQDGCVIHTAIGENLTIGDNVSIGHRAVVHCAEVKSNALVGIGAILLDGCKIGQHSIVAAGAVVAPGTVVPANTLVMGIPARRARATTDKDSAYLAQVVARYVQLARRHAHGDFPNAAMPSPTN